MLKSSLFFSELLEKHFLYIEACTLLDFFFVSVIIKQQIQRSIGTPLASLIMKSSFLFEPEWVSFRIFTSKYSAGVTVQYFVWFSSSSTFCKRCFAILIIPLSFWTHGKSMLVQILDFVILLFYFNLRKCDSGAACSIQGTFSKVAYSHYTLS